MLIHDSRSVNTCKLVLLHVRLTPYTYIYANRYWSWIVENTYKIGSLSLGIIEIPLGILTSIGILGIDSIFLKKNTRNLLIGRYPIDRYKSKPNAKESLA